MVLVDGVLGFSLISDEDWYSIKIAFRIARIAQLENSSAF